MEGRDRRAEDRAALESAWGPTDKNSGTEPELIEAIHSLTGHDMSAVGQQRSFRFTTQSPDNYWHNNVYGN